MRRLITLLAIAWLTPPTAAQLTSTAVFKTGDAAPGTPAGATYSSFAAPAVNSSGQVLVFGFVQGTGIGTANNTGLWLAGTGGQELVARSGGDIPPGSSTGRPFESFGNYRLSETGRANFYATLQNTFFPDDHGVWTYGDGALSLIGRSGGQVVGQPAGTTHGQFLQGPRTNAAGAVAFASLVMVNGVDQPSALWIGTAAGLTPHLRAGQTPAPGMGAGATFAFYQLDNFNAAGHLAFFGYAAGGSVTADNDYGIWAGAPDNLQLVAREGSPVTPGGGNLFSFLPPQLNDQGQLLFHGSMTGVPATNNNALWLGTPGAMTVLAQKGSQAAGMPAGVNYGDLVDDRVNSNRLADGGAVAFTSSVAGAGVTAANDKALWVGTADNLAAPIREGDDAPGLPGVKFGEFPDFGEPALSGLGLAAVVAKLTGEGVTAANDESLWVAGPRTLTKVAREGDVIDLDPGPGENLKTISALALQPDGFQSHHLAWGAEFTDGTEVIFLTPVPEPGSVMLAAGGVLIAGGWVRRLLAGRKQ